MKPLADQMAVYAAYHRDPVNRAIHFVFVPVIVWSLMVLLSIPAPFVLADTTLYWSMVAAFVLLLYYLQLDYALGIAMVAVFTVLEVLALQTAALGRDAALLAGGAGFVIGFGMQFVGHGAFEHRRPALVDNVWQIFVAPIFVVAEWAFALGLRRGLKAQVHAGMLQHLPTAAT